MDRKVVILPNDGSEVFERVLGVTSSGQLERHSVGYLEYMKQKGLEYPGCESDAGYNLATYLSSIGCVVLQIDDMSVIYFPEYFINSHYCWLKSHKREIRRWSFFILDIEDNCFCPYDNATLEGVQPYQKFREILENKKIVSISEIKKGEKIYVSRFRNS